MKKGKMLQRVAAVLLAGTMMMAMGTTVFAEEEPTSVTSVDLIKAVSAKENVLAPNTSFTFSVNPVKVDAGTKVDGAVVYSGVGGGASFEEGKNTISFTPGDDLEKNTQISLNASVFEKPGIYRYQVNETAGDYDGMTYSTASYYLDLYVVNGSNGRVIEGAIARNANGTKEKEIKFENTYTTNNLTLKKVIEGNQANLSEKFEFNVTINGAPGEKYTVVANGQEEVVESGVTVTYNLGNDETVTFYGLSENDTYTIGEKDYSSDGYTTTITIDGAGTTNNLTATGKTAAKDVNVIYTNTKEVSTPTGIVMNIAPYVLMVAVAAVLAVVFLRKRNNFEN